MLNLNKIKKVTALFSALFFSGILYVSAASLNYVPLAPLGTAPGNPVVVSDYIPTIFSLAIGLAAALAVIMMIIGGIQYLSTDAISGKQDGKERIQNALIGLLLAVGSYAILNTINPKILVFDFGNVQSQLPPGDSDGDGVADSFDQCPKTPAGSPVDSRGCLSAVGAIWPSDDAERASLTGVSLNGVRIQINHNNCTVIGETNCTSVLGFGSTIRTAEIVNLFTGCQSVNPACQVIITGGSEYWLHGNNSQDEASNPTDHKVTGSAFDLSMSDSVFNSFIRSFPQVTNRPQGCPSGEAYSFGSFGYVYVNELGAGAPHWHVCR